jgi:hypothetical protein
MVYLKIQPYRHTSLTAHKCLKLHSKYYGPFHVLSRVGPSAYKILLSDGCQPDDCQLHDVFHVSQLKKHLAPHAIQAGGFHRLMTRAQSK